MKLSAATHVRVEPDALVQRALDPVSHARWDLRFSAIEPFEAPGPDAPRRFRYSTNLGFGQSIDGWGETVGKERGDGTVLRFGSEDRRSLIREGIGSWTWRTDGRGLRFSTTYDYSVRFGAVGRFVDRIALRPLMTWATRWSFDRLRLWLEQGIAPELALRLWGLKVLARLALGLVWIWEGLVPKVLWVVPYEVERVRGSGLWVGSPAGTLAALGIAQCLLGLVLLIGWRERLAVLVATAVMIPLSALVVVLDPESLAEPLGGIVKNAALLVCALTVAWLSPHSPLARRAR